MVLCSAFLFLTLSSKAQVIDPGQIYNTGNIVLNTPQGGPTPWTGGVYQDSLTCWYGGDPGYCGPSGIVRPGNNINFSYGSSYLYQQQHISTLLPSATGLQVNGYNFGFTAKNGNGWDDGRTDSLMALVRFWDNTGGRGATNLLYGNAYSLNYQFNWTTFNYSETFTTPLAVPSIGQVQYGFIGRDNNGWAGPYGPEIRDINFSLKYSVDPCTTNVLSSPSCPGYLEAIAKLSPLAPAPTVIAEAPPPPVFDSGPMNSTGQLPPPGSSTPPPPGSPPPPDGSQTQQQQPGPSQAGTPLPGPTQQASAAQAAPSPTQTKVGEISDSSGSSKSTVSLSSVLSMIGSNQEKTAALEKSVVQTADAQAFSAGETAKQTAEKVAGEAQSQSIASSGSQASTLTQTSGTQTSSGPTQNSGLPIQGNLQSNTMLNAARLEQSIASGSMSQSYSGSSSGSTLIQNNQSDNRQDFAVSVPQVVAYVPKTDFGNKVDNNYVMPQPKYEPPQTTETMGLQVPVVNVSRTTFENKQDTSASSMSSVLPPARYEPPKFENTASMGTQTFQYQPPVFRQDTVVAMVSTPVTSYNIMPPAKPQQAPVEAPALEGIKFGGNKNPVESAIEARPILLQTTTTQQMDTLKKNVQNNELAGGVTIESIAKQPTNYAQYFTMIPDAAFYAPKEIYRNQKTIDNERAFRSLGSDRLHQQMIDQQYK